MQISFISVHKNVPHDKYITGINFLININSLFRIL